LRPTKPPQRAAEAGQKFRPRLSPDRADQPFDGVVVLLRAEAEHAHQMQAVGMVWIELQRLLTGELRAERPSGRQFANARSVKRGRRGGGFRFWSQSGVAGVPALAGVHRRIPNGVSGESVDDSCLCGKVRFHSRRNFLPSPCLQVAEPQETISKSGERTRSALMYAEPR